MGYMYAWKTRLLAFFAISTLVIFYNFTSVSKNVLEMSIESEVPGTLTLQKTLILNRTLRTLVDQTAFLMSYRQMYLDRQKSGNKSRCDIYDGDSQLKRFHLPSIWKSTLTVKDDDVTLVTQLSFGRVNLIKMLLKNWSGPLSIAIYVEVEDLPHFQLELQKYPSILERNNIDIHIAIAAGKYYPVNFLRELAFRNTRTKYVFLNDVDFIPRQNATEIIKGHIAKEILGDKQVFVVPALEFADMKSFEAVENEVVAKRLITEGKLINFHGISWPPGHRPTNIKKWCEVKNPYYVNWHKSYEPYIVGEKKHLPGYNTAFVGRFGDKISHLLHVHAMGFKFLVLPDVYTIHYPHPKAGTNNNYLSCAARITKRFYEELKLKYPDQL